MNVIDSMPTVQLCRVESNIAHLSLVMPGDLQFFKGHFPGFPVLPAVAQVYVVITYARELLGVSGIFSGLQNLKLRQPIRPDVPVNLSLEWQATPGKLKFLFLSNGETASSGTIEFVP